MIACSALFLAMAGCLAAGIGQATGTGATNPILWADVPDPSIIRVGSAYYMASTTMHLSPGLPIMRSQDLVNWQVVSYAYDRLSESPALCLAEGRNAYGAGSWAPSLRCHNGRYFVSTFSATTGRTHIYTTRDLEHGPWSGTSFAPALHDGSLWFEDDGRIFMIHGGGDVRLTELAPGLDGIKAGGVDQVIIRNASLVAGPEIGLPAEGSQVFRGNGKYYLFMITWPRNGVRTQLVFRSDRLAGPWEGRVALRDGGVAQGGIVDTPDGRWFALVFQDHGAVGRTPWLVPVRWEDGWPILGADGKAPTSIALPDPRGLVPGLLSSDEFDRGPGDAPLPLVWQWNHNPVVGDWSLARRPGYLRLTTSRVDDNLLGARNTLTQRTVGPRCSAVVALDVSGLQDGDCAGLALLQRRYGYAGVIREAGGLTLVMAQGEGGAPDLLERVPLSQQRVYLRAICDFANRADLGRFEVSLDGRRWRAIGQPLHMVYTLPHFMGYRFALFCFSTRQAGGHADFDYFRVEEPAPTRPSAGRSGEPTRSRR